MSHANKSVSKTPSQRTEPADSKSQVGSGSTHHQNGKPRKMSDLSQGPGLLEMVAGDEPEEDEKLAAHSSSIIRFYPDWCRCCLGTKEPLGENATFQEHFKDFFQCPPTGTFARLLLCTLICLLLWGLLLFLFEPTSRRNKDGHHELETNPAWVKGPLFALGIVEITGLISGILLKKFLNLPPLLGPLILGIMYKNIQPLNLFNKMMADYDFRDCKPGDELCKKEAEITINNWVKPIRVIALGIILTRAGLELSPKQLSKLKGVVPLLAFGPCVVEACACAITSFLFFNVMVDVKFVKMDLAMCFVGGFALAAVSPAVVVPGALSLKKAGYGVVKGVPTLLIAASSIDDVLAISIYTIALGFAIKQEGQQWKTYSAGVIGLTIGILHGIILGMILHFLPTRNSKYKAHNRLLLLLLINFTSVMGYEGTFFNGAGSISVLVTSLIAGFGWRSQPHWKLPMKKIEKALAHMWVLWVPLIFGTIGKEIDFKSAAFKPPVIYKIFGVISISLVVRCTTAFFAAGCGTGFNFKERFFIALSWIPKATVQAALAPLVLTRAAELPLDPTNTATNNINQGIQYNAVIVVNIAILAVLFTAPVGCILIALVGPKFLEQNSSPEIIMAIESEFPNGEGIDPEESIYELVNDARAKRLTQESTGLEEVITTLAQPPAPSTNQSILTSITTKAK